MYPSTQKIRPRIKQCFHRIEQNNGRIWHVSYWTENGWGLIFRVDLIFFFNLHLKTLSQGRTVERKRFSPWKNCAQGASKQQIEAQLKLRRVLSCSALRKEKLLHQKGVWPCNYQCFTSVCLFDAPCCGDLFRLGWPTVHKNRSAHN